MPITIALFSNTFEYKDGTSVISIKLSETTPNPFIKVKPKF